MALDEGGLEFAQWLGAPEVALTFAGVGVAFTRRPALRQLLGAVWGLSACFWVFAMLFPGFLYGDLPVEVPSWHFLVPGCHVFFAGALAFELIRGPSRSQTASWWSHSVVRTSLWSTSVWFVVAGSPLSYTGVPFMADLGSHALFVVATLFLLPLPLFRGPMLDADSNMALVRTSSLGQTANTCVFLLFALLT